jgi:AcrR family transcriptional regulator
VSRKDQARASRAALVEAARQCFAERGYDATTVAEILRRAGMARGALYHYFPGGKRDVFQAVFEKINEAFHEGRDALAHLESPLARIRAGVRVFLALCTQDDFARIVLVDAPKLVPGQADRGSSYALMLAQIEEAKAQGELPDVDPEALAMALYGAVRSAGEFVIEARDREHAVAEACRSVELLLAGLGTRAQPVADLRPAGREAGRSFSAKRTESVRSRSS